MKNEQLLGNRQVTAKTNVNRECAFPKSLFTQFAILTTTLLLSSSLLPRLARKGKSHHTLGQGSTTFSFQCANL